MKTMLWILVAAAALTYARAQQLPAEIGDGVAVLPIGRLPKNEALFYSVSARVEAGIALGGVTTRQRLEFTLHQGVPEQLDVEVAGNGEIVSVKGEGVGEWSVKTGTDGRRFLVIKAEGGMKPGATRIVEVETKDTVADGAALLLLPGAGSATAFSMDLTLVPEKGVKISVAESGGILPVEGGGGLKFVATRTPSLRLSVAPDGTGASGVEFLDAALKGRVSADGGSVSFHLSGRVKAAATGSSALLLGGTAAISGGVSGDGWHVTLEKRNDVTLHRLIAERAGEFPLSVDFDAPLAKRGDWRSLDFEMPGGVIVPMSIEGLEPSVEFAKDLLIVPIREGDVWKGYLPANGEATMAWRRADAVENSALFFSSTETTDIRLGNGLLRQSTAIETRILQGKLPAISLAMEGPGEVLSVTGESVLGWTVKETAGKRGLEVSLSRPMERSGRIVIDSQSALRGFPVKAQALRLVPAGALRHSGWLRVANEGAVRIEIADANGLIQLAPGQFPGGEHPKLRQVFVYRFPSAEYGYSVLADQVLPEIGVTEVTVYELAETDRRVFSDIELDIREAPLREWEMDIPADHAVASVTGSAVADYIVGEEKAGRRKLKILFSQPVMDRESLSVRLERNDAAKAGAWQLSPLVFPGVKSTRGYVGAVAAPGYRLAAGATTGVAEVPLTFFPKKVAGLQQTFRLKEAGWKVGLSVEALGQSIQADVFHLYSLKAGAAYGSVLMNFFVVGAPATEWRISVPAAIGNIDVSGQNVGRDWRREGDVVIVPLSRPVLGAGTMLLTFEQPMNARGGDLSPGEVRPLNVQGERGYVQVVSPLQVNYDVTRSDGPLLKLDASELPAEFRLLSTAPTLGSWQYTSRDFSIGMKVRWFDQGALVGQMVDFLKLSSHVSKDGQWVTDARFFVKSKEQGGLRLKLPEGGVLWEARVAGETVNARAADGEWTLIPLPARNDPNQAVEVALRYGGGVKHKGRPELSAPVLDVPVVMGEWTVSGDEDRMLVPKGGNAGLAAPVLAPTGWQWLGERKGPVFVLMAAVMLMLAFGRKNGLPLGIGIGAALIALTLSSLLMMAGIDSREGIAHPRAVEYAAPVVKAGTRVVVELANIPLWRANLGAWVWICLMLAAITAMVSRLKGLPYLRPVAMILAAAGLLSIRDGAAWFFLACALAVVVWWLPALAAVVRSLKGRRAAVAAASAIALMCIGASDARAGGTGSAESMVQDWRISNGRLRGTMEVVVRGGAGDRFLLLNPPAVLGGFNASGMRIVKAPHGEGEAYFVELTAAGRASGKADFEMPLADPAKGWTLPGGPAVMRQVTVRWNEKGWEFFSPEAARTSVPQDLAEGESGARFVLQAAEEVTIQARPKQRNASTEETKYFAEVSNFFIPGPGVVTGRHRISLRPSQGRVSSLTLKVPDGFTVSDVKDGPVGSWRFDPEKKELRVTLEFGQEQAFAFTVESQRGAGALPVELSLEPLRVLGAASEVGYLALGFGEEAQPESVDAIGLSKVNPEDIDAGGRPANRSAKAEPARIPVQHAFRYGAAAASVKVKVIPVAPELRAESSQLVSLGEDRLIIAEELVVNITRAGVFKLVLAVPEGLEVETATGEGLSHWTDSGKGRDRSITLQLSGKTMGRQVFNLTFTGTAVTANPSWSVPRISLRDASRETGILTVVPERGLQVRAVDRRNISQLDPRQLSSKEGDAAKAAARPGALAYRLLQGDWSLGLGISKLDPWVTAQVFHEATLREGQVLTHVLIGYKIENAALKSLRVRIPGLDADSAATVRATGPAVADLVPVSGDEGLWEIRFQRGIAGETKVDLEYQRRTGEGGRESIRPIVLEQVRQSSYFVAIRAGGRLEVEADSPPRGWQREDWSVVQGGIGASAAGSAAPLMSFRVAEPEGPLPVILKRHDLAELRKLRVSEGKLASLISPMGESLTAVTLRMETTGKGTLRLRLPEDSRLFNVFVNDEGVNLVREGEEWLFHVFPSPVEGQPASVRFVYSAGGESERLEGPRLDVPMENLSWRVFVPDGWKLSSHGGDFDLKGSAQMGMFRLEDYQSFVNSKRESDSREAVAMLDQANVWLQKGDQGKASVAFDNAMNRGNLLDQASNEDARVQLRQLKTQQAVLGLNTRRQKLVLDQNAGEKEQMEKAAEVNPVLRGDVNYDPKDFERFTAGNTADENAALKEIANRIVSQQLAAEPAPAALEVTLPERGTVHTFSRSVQVDGGRAMAIELGLRKENSGWWTGVLACGLLGLLGGSGRKVRTV